MTKSMTDTESILRSVDMSVSGLSAIPLVLKGLSSLHNWTNVSSRSVMKGILPHRFRVGSIDDRRPPQPSLFAIPLDGSCESFRKADRRWHREIAWPADPVRMVELAHLVRGEERRCAKQARRSPDRSAGGKEQRARQIDRRDVAAPDLRCDRDQIRP